MSRGSIWERLLIERDDERESKESLLSARLDDYDNIEDDNDDELKMLLSVCKTSSSWQ